MDTYKESLIAGLEKLLADPKCFLLGEDIADPYGGAYTITKGMSAEIRRANETQKPVRYFSNKCKEVH